MLMISCRDVSPNLSATNTNSNSGFLFFSPPSIQTLWSTKCEFVSLLGQRLLLVDAHVKVHRLDPQQHSALDLPRQRVEHAARQRDPDVEAVPVARDDWQHVGCGAAGCLGDLS